MTSTFSINLLIKSSSLQNFLPITKPEKNFLLTTEDKFRTKLMLYNEHRSYRTPKDALSRKAKTDIY